MAIQVAQGVINAPLVGGNKTYTIGFQAKVVFLYATLQTATGWGAAPAEAELTMGTACSDNSASNNGTIARNGTATSRIDGPAGTGARCIAIYRTSAPLVDCQADFVGFTATGFTLNWTVAASAAWNIYYYAIGGSDILQSITKSLFENTTPAVQSNSSAGFRADFTQVHQGSAFGSFGWAVGTDASQQASMHHVEVTAENPASSSETYNPGTLGGTFRTTGAAHPFTINEDSLFALSQFTAAGFEITASLLPANTRAFAFTSIRGGSHYLVVRQAPVATGNESIALPFGPVGAAAWSPMRTAAGTSQDIGFAFGTSDGTNQAVCARGDTDNVSPTVTNHYSSQTDFIATAMTLATPSIDSLASVVSFDPAGITLNWSKVTGNQEDYVLWVCGPAQNLHLLPILGVGA